MTTPPPDPDQPERSGPAHPPGPMPDDGRARHRRISEILADAIERPEAEREAFVRAACAGDAQLGDEVLDLLGAHDDGFLEPGSTIAAARRAAADELPHPDTDPADIEIAGYRVIRPIGSGGMGSVYEAEQAIPRRRVAIKVLGSLDRSPESRRRFRFETEVLARLRHPGIAQIYEAGTARVEGGERPFFAMEFVENADTITAFADRAGLGALARARLFVDVCRAVQCGHQRGVIHRDLKPGNILVDGEGHVKIIDYGVARVTESSTVHASVRAGVRTVAGGLVGTVRYMSPEQVGGDPDAIDARTDVYALGVVLYELLTGRAPYDLERTSIAGAARIIESHDPARPSSADPGLRGDAEAILMRALEKDPDARYASAAALGDDLERWLAGLPVEARAVTTVYLLRKFAGRHRGAAAATLVAVCALIGATLFSSGMAVHATRAAASEREQRASLEDLNGYLAGILTSVTPEATRSQEITVREMLDDAVARIETELAQRPRLAATLRHRIGESYISVGAHAEAERVLASAWATRRDDLGDHPDTLSTLVRLSSARMELGDFSGALDGFGRAVAMAERLGDLGRTPIAIEAMGGLGVASARSGDFETGVTLLRAAIDDARTAGVSDEQRLTLMNTLASVRARMGSTDDALAMLRDIVDERSRILGADHPSTLTSTNNLGLALVDAERFDEAELTLRTNLDDRVRVLGPGHPETLSSMNNLSLALSRLGRAEEAGVLKRRVLERRTASLGRSHPDTITAAMNLYSHLGRVDRGEEADALLEEYLPIAESVLEPANPIRLVVTSKSVMADLKSGAYSDAAGTARRALGALTGVVDESFWEVGRFRALLGTALSLSGDLDEGGRELERGVAGLTASRGADHPWTRWARARLDEHRARAEEASGGGDAAP